MSAPKLDAQLPTPATEWADQAHAALAPPAAADTPAFDTSSQPPLMSPGLDIPGAFPPDDESNESIYPQAAASARPALARVNSGGAKDAIHASANAYLAPERLDQVEHLVEGVGHTAARFVPTGVASAVSSYWYGSRPTEPTGEPPASKPQPGVGNGNGNGTIPGSYNAADSRAADSPAVENAQAAPTPAAPVPQEAPKVMEAPPVTDGASAQKAEVAPADVVDPSTPEPPVLVAAPAPEPVVEETPAPAPPPAPAPVADVAEEKEDRTAAPAEETHEKEEAAAGLGMAGVGAGVAAYAAASKDENEKPAVVDDDTFSAPAQPAVVLAARRYAMGSAPPAPKEQPHAPSITTPTSTPAPPEPDVSDAVDGVGAADHANAIGARGAWDVPENKDAGSARAGADAGVEKAPVAAPEAQLEHGGASGADADRQGTDADETKSGADHISDLQGLAKEKHAGAGAAEGEKEKAVETPAPVPVPAPTPVPVSAPAPAPAAAKAPLSPPSTPRKVGDPGYHPAVLHPMTPSTKAANAAAAANGSAHERPTSPFGSLSKKGGHGRAASGSVSSVKHNRAASVSSTASGKKKVGFFDKVRGEAKIVMGKIEHKKEKVEAGKRILHGED